ncbi:MAG: hypothetical protein H7X88_04755 [Gloeobacteraceae cyanobacterium ES-bin-316]|nr:hypothetical protein [Ferruginibacter sp.]
MYQPDNILNELNELSPLLAGIARVNVFSTPEGYFETLSGLLLLQVHGSGNLEQSNFTKENNAVPEGYFENLADNILDRIKKESLSDVATETNSISSLIAGIGNKNIYTVPEGYFANFCPNILAETSQQSRDVFVETQVISAEVAGIGNQNVYTVPAGYFSQVADNVLALLNQDMGVLDETRELSELVASIGNKNIYNVPQGYFENLPEGVMQKTAPTAKVVNMRSRFSAFKYAVAAAVTGFIAFSTFFMLNKDSGVANTQTAVMTEASQIIKANSFDKEMNSISDDAIVAFLENKGQNVEAALVASLVDDKNLPDADEYLLNENALDDILNTLELNN